MATRLYLQSTGASAVTAPALPAGWTAGTTGAVQRKTTTAKANTALTDFLVAEITASITNIPVGIFISNPLVGASISGNLTAVVRGLESATTADDSLQVGVYLIANDGTTVKSTLYSGHTTALGSTNGTLGQEFATAAATRIIPSTAITGQTAVTGDRLMVIVGYRAHNTTTASRSSTLRFGDPTAPADFALTAALTTDLVPWVELSATLTFSDPLAQTLPDNVGVTDAGLAATRSITISEQVIVADSWTVSQGSPPTVRSQTDNVGVTDSGTSASRQPAISEMVFVTDTVVVDQTSGAGSHVRTITDNVGVDDTPGAETRSYDEVPTDNVGVTDTVIVGMAATAAGTITLGGTPTARGAGTGGGTLTLTGAAAATGAATAAGTVTLGGSGTGVVSGNTAAGTLTLTGTATARGAATAAGTVTLGGTPTGRGGGTGGGTLTLGGTGTPAAANTAAGSISLTGTATGSTGSVSATAAGSITLSGTATGAATLFRWLFRTPTRHGQGPRLTVNASPAQTALMRHIHHHGGYPVAVYINDGVVGEKAVPTTNDMQAWDVTYMGGRENVVLQAEYDLLVAAGYGPYLTPI